MGKNDSLLTRVPYFSVWSSPEREDIGEDVSSLYAC